MDPYYEQRLREEVIYLHSLWHQGPPKPYHPNHHPITPTYLHPTTSTQFKKTQRGKRGKNTKIPLPPTTSDLEWPIKPPTEPLPPTTSGWPITTLKSQPTTRLPSLEEQARFAANRAQEKALKSTNEFFTDNNNNSDNDGDDDDDDEDDDADDDDMGCEEYNFFTKVFDEDSELRVYYEKNYEKGEFCCLVCGGVEVKFVKRWFKGCVALVQHSMKIAKTKKRRAHRVYGKVVCNVLGWDIDQLPSVVSSLTGAKSGEAQGNADDGKEMNNVGTVNANGLQAVSEEGNDDNGKERNNLDSVDANDCNVVPVKVSIPCGSLPHNGELTACENALPSPDANTCMEYLEKGVLNKVDGNADGMGESDKEHDVGLVGNEIKDNQTNNVVRDGLKEESGNQN